MIKLCLVVQQSNKDGSTSSTSSVEMIKNDNEMVTVNNCVNIDYNKASNLISDIDSKNDSKNNNYIINDEKIVNSIADDDEKLSKFNNDKMIDDLNDDDAIATSSNYLAIVSHSDRDCEMSPSSSTSAILPHVAQSYAPTPDNNRNHRKAVRKNFSLWIGVTSCVWACLVWLMKNYA